MYYPNQVPGDPAMVPEFLRRELAQIARSFAESVPYLLLDTIHKEPVKRPDGMIVKADGSTWNPGSGAGVYVRSGGAWIKL